MAEQTRRNLCTDLCDKDLTCAAAMLYGEECDQFGQFAAEQDWTVSASGVGGCDKPAFCHAKPPGTCKATTMTYVGQGKCLDSAGKSPPYHEAVSAHISPRCRTACFDSTKGCVAFAERKISNVYGVFQYECTIYGTFTPHACTCVASSWGYVHS